MRYLSLFSGIEAASVAWEPLGWEPIAFAEIEEFPSAVLAERYPDVPNLGDVTKVDWSRYRGAVDVLVGGSPCQAFSVAGQRGGCWTPEVASCSSLFELVERLGLDLSSGKTSPVFCRRTRGEPLLPSSQSWRTSGFLAHGECLTLNTSVFPSDASASFLSDVLELEVPHRYYLSAKACLGILRRAERSGKSLPPMLDEAVREAAQI